MKKLILAATMALSFSASADLCKPIQEDAKSTMDARQRGVSINTVIGIAKEVSEDDELFDSYLRMILRAYNTPQYDTGKYRAKASREFALEYYIACKQLVV
jgi:hypothetical protein